MSTVHPDFCPHQGNWRAQLGGRAYTSKTLAQLQRALPPGTAIVGYYPDGAPRELYWQDGLAPTAHHVIQAPTKEQYLARNRAATARLSAERLARAVVAEPVLRVVKEGKRVEAVKAERRKAVRGPRKVYSGRGRDTSDDVQILRLRDLKVPQLTIAERLGISVGKVQRCLRAHNRTGHARREYAH